MELNVSLTQKYSNSTLTRINISMNKEHRYFQTGSHENISRSVCYWSLPDFSEYSEDTIWGKVSGCCLVLPSLGARRAHSCHSHPWSWWRHELQTSGLSGTRPGFMWLHLSPFHMQSFEPGLQSEGLPCRMGKHGHSVRQYQTFLYPCDWMYVLLCSLLYLLVFSSQDYLKSQENFNIRHIFVGGKLQQ